VRLDLYRLTFRDELCQLAGTLTPATGDRAEELGLGLKPNTIRSVVCRPDFHFRVQSMVAASLREAINARR
jgi:hypothetical protein